MSYTIIFNPKKKPDLQMRKQSHRDIEWLAEASKQLKPQTWGLSLSLLREPHS